MLRCIAIADLPFDVSFRGVRNSTLICIFRCNVSVRFDRMGRHRLQGWLREQRGCLAGSHRVKWLR
jgi:hypothetical protein